MQHGPVRVLAVAHGACAAVEVCDLDGTLASVLAISSPTHSGASDERAQWQAHGTHA